ncbi:MAG: hypothetical protein LUB61_00840, partial [Eggerthellaceae bacterium]|nr:hypothetical protein [Eggerthellaceae bacterium]
MAKNFDPKVYGAILRTRQAYVFDAACFLMRFYIFMLNIGIITMLTLSGHSFLIAGLVSSTIALATFFISPRISKVIDEKGQSRIVPIFSAITIAGLIILLSDVVLDGPEPVLFVGAILMGCVPNPQALARTRWIFLIKTGRLKDKAPELRTMFSYESVMDDVGFMFSPAISIALASALFPSAGMITGGVAFVVGVIMLTCAKSTAPTPGWGEPAETAHHDKSVIRTSRVVVVLFLLMLCFGGFFGVFDTSTVALAEEFGAPTLASLVLVVASLESKIVGF